MIKISFKEIIDFVKPLKIIGKKIENDFFIEKIFIDSRKIENGKYGAFVCIKGENFDAHDFIQQVIEKNVDLIFVENEEKIPYFLLNEATFIKVKNSVETLGNLAKIIIHKKRELNKDFIVIAIGGAAGKTTTKNLLKNIFEFSGYKVVASEKSFNNEIGVPLTIFKVEENTDILILEMGMRGFGQLEYLCQISEPNYGIITSIGPEHLEFVQNIKGVIQAETELTEFLETNGRYFLIPNKIRNLYENYQNFNYFPNKKYFIKNYNIIKKENQYLTMCEIFFNGKSYLLKISSILSKTILLNFLVSLMMFEKISKNYELINKIIDNAENIILKSLEKNRFFFEQLSSSIFVINDFYNSNYLSLNENLKVVEKIVPFFEKVFLFIGDMLELGKYSNFYHRKIVKKISNYPFKVKTIFIGKNFYKYRENVENSKFFEKFDDSFINEIIENWVITKDRSNILVFIKGSRALKLERIYEKLSELLKY